MNFVVSKIITRKREHAHNREIEATIDSLRETDTTVHINSIYAKILERYPLLLVDGSKREKKETRKI